jgi:hypothetical protein
VTTFYDALFLLALGSPVIVGVGFLVRSLAKRHGHADRLAGRLLLGVGLLGATYGAAVMLLWSS